MATLSCFYVSGIRILYNETRACVAKNTVTGLRYLYRQENNLFIATNDLGSKQLLDITMTGSISCSKNYMTIILGKNGISHDFFIRDSAESIKQHREAIITPDELVTVIFQQI